MSNIKILYYDKTGFSEGNDINKTNESKECDVCHYWYFLDKEFKFQPDVCIVGHDVLFVSMNLSYIVILNIHGADYGCIISGISKSEAVNLLQKTDLKEKA